MDPDANIQEQLEIAYGIIEGSPALVARYGSIEEQASRLAELVVALDQWLLGYGFLPNRWRRKCCSHDPDMTKMKVTVGSTCLVSCRYCEVHGQFRFEHGTAEIMWEED